MNYFFVYCREDTIKIYNRHYSTVKEYFKSINLVYTDEITKPVLNNMIQKFKATIRDNGKPWSNNTIQKYVDLIKMIIKYNHDNDYIEHNNIGTFKKLPQEKVETKTVEDDNVEKIFNYINKLDLSDTTNLRNVLFMNLLKDTGVRINELIHIEVENVNLNDNSLLLTFTKVQNANRELFYNNYTKYLLKRYIDRIEPKDFLFMNKDNQPMTKNSVYKFLDKLRSKLRIEQSISPHKWRHTYATNLLLKKVNIKVIQESLGHTSLKATEKYLHLTRRKIKKVLYFILWF